MRDEEKGARDEEKEGWELRGKGVLCEMRKREPEMRKKGCVR